jgi:protein TonB
MATCIDHLSDLGLRIDSRVAALPAEEKKQLPVPSSRQATDAGEIFHDSLIESAGKLRARNPWAAIGSLAFQAVLLLAVVVIPLFHTDTLPKREMLTVLYLQPPAAAASNATRLQAPTPTYTSTGIGIPAPIRRTQEVPPAVGTTGGVVGGVPGGVVGGVPGGTLSEVLGSTRSAPVLAKTLEPTPIKRIRVASRVAEANLIHDVSPQYPPEAGRARIEGTVVLMALIGKDGSVQDVQVESGLPILAEAAMDAVKQWRYKPYLINGEPVEVDSRITINFTLSAS